MSRPFTRLASGALGLSLALGVALPASADSDRTQWIQSLREHRYGVQVQPSPVTSTTRARAERQTAAAQVQPRYRMISGRLVPIEPTGSFAAPQPIRVPTTVRSAAVAPAIVQPQAPQQTRPITRQMDPQFLPTEVAFSGYKPGTIVIDTEDKFLYLQLPGGVAKRYGVGVGRPGFQWSGTHTISMKREWPGWTPPPEMRKRQPELPAFMEGGPDNPLGARAMYLGSSLYRIHGSNAPWTIGQEVSSGCIRMRNEDVVDLYERVKVGTKVIVTR